MALTAQPDPLFAQAAAENPKDTKFRDALSKWSGVDGVPQGFNPARGKIVTLVDKEGTPQRDRVRAFHEYIWKDAQPGDQFAYLHKGGLDGTGNGHYLVIITIKGTYEGYADGITEGIFEVERRVVLSRDTKKPGRLQVIDGIMPDIDTIDFYCPGPRREGGQNPYRMAGDLMEGRILHIIPSPEAKPAGEPMKVKADKPVREAVSEAVSETLAAA